MNLDLAKINLRPIIVVSTPRSGSSVLAHYIADALKCEFFNQPTKTAQELHKFFLYDQRNKNYVLKEHAMVLLQKYSNIFDQPSYKIRIRRRDIFRQVLSHYIASQRKKFLFARGDNFEPDIIKMDEQTLINYYNYTVMNNRESELFRHHIDLDLYYEDLDFPDSPIIHTVEPLNNDELMEWAQSVLGARL